MSKCCIFRLEIPSCLETKAICGVAWELCVGLRLWYAKIQNVISITPEGHLIKLKAALALVFGSFKISLN